MLDLSDAGFLSDPTSQFLSSNHARPLTLDELAAYRGLILLGEPGMGKSTTLKMDEARLSAQDSQLHAALKVDLRAFSSEAALCRRTFETAEFRSWASGSTQMVLYLDSLDEALLRIDSIASFLADELPRYPVERLSIRIACRTAVWPGQTLEPALKRIWGEGAVAAFELAPLRRRDVIAASELQQIDPDEFLRAVFGADAVLFAIKPLTLNMLFNIYKREGRLPRSITELYNLGCLTLAEEANPSRRDSSRRGSLSARQRLRVAGRIAATTVLSNRYAIWTGREADNVPPEDILVSALAGDRETGEFSPVDVTEEHIREVLDTGLFTARGPQRMGWAHQGYAEFLAAQYLLDKGVTSPNVLKVVLHPSGGLVPQLATVAARASSLSLPIRRALMHIEPLTLLRSDLSLWEPRDIAALTDAFLLALEEKRASDYPVNIANLYSRLTHPGLAGQLRKYILDSSKSIMTRRAAIMIAEACALTELQPELLQLALSTSEEISLRARAVAALRRCGDETAVAGPLRELMKSVSASDSQDEVRGYVLQLLWPRHLSASELFSSLHRPNEGFTGSYVMFAHYILPDSIAPSDLPVALKWASSYVAGAGHEGNFHLNFLADAIFVRAWPHMGEPAVLSALVSYVRTCLAELGDLFRGTDRRLCEAFLDGIRTQRDHARRFLLALAREEVDGAEVYNLRRFSLLLPEDLQWLLALAPGGSTPNPTLNEESLCNLVDRLWDLEKVSDFEIFADAASRWPLLYKRYQLVLEGVPIYSEVAQQDKERYELVQSFRLKEPEPLSPTPAERVALQLDRSESGVWRAFWWLIQELTLTPTSRYYTSDFNCVITTMPGWFAADAHTRERIIRAAERYLAIGKTSVFQWIGTTRCRLNDIAAFRALVLLYQQDPIAYARIPAELWRRWAPAIAAMPVIASNGESGEVQERVLADVLEKAPVEFVKTIRTIIHRERTTAGEGTNQVPGLPFHHLHDLKPCWRNEDLCRGVLEELKSKNNTPEQFGVLAEFLLRAKFERALEYVLTRLRGGGFQSQEMLLAAANALASNVLSEAWPLLWPLIRDDQEFARGFFLQYARRHSFSSTAFDELAAQQMAEVYVRLEEVFPGKDDPIRNAGEVHCVGPLEQVAHLRDQLPRQIAGRGTPEAVGALRWIGAQLPEVSWLPFVLRDAEQLARIRTWIPLSPNDIRNLVANVEAQLVQSPEDLVDVLIDSLHRYEHELHGEQPTVRALWDRQSSGDEFRPVEEDELSNHVKRFLQDDLVGRGIIANREVEVGRVPGAPVGKRTDIRIDAMRRGPDGKSFDAITAVIETKGCWNRGLFSSLEAQLYHDYMERIGAPVGIYLVGWFDKRKWDVTDHRRGSTPDITRNEAQKRLGEQASSIPAGSCIRAVVLDCHAP